MGSSWPADATAPQLLVPVDGSQDAASALALALRLARAAGATLAALYVAERGLFLRRRRIPPRPLDEFAEGQADDAEEAKLVLMPARVWGKSAGVHVDMLAARGDAAAEIVAAGDARRAALIVMGTHGKSAGSDGRLLGSVSRAVFTQSARPTVVVPPRAVVDAEALARDIGRESEGLPIGPKVVAALDGGPGSDAVANEAVELARRTHGSVRFFSGGPPWRGADLPTVFEAAQQAAQAVGVPFKVDKGAEDALAGLVAISEQDRAAIVVVGTRAAPGHTRDHLGSFTDRLLAKVACPVEVLRLGAGA